MGPSARRTISIECSEDTLPQLAPGLSTVEKIDVLTRLARTEYGVEVVFVIYQGMTSSYAGGRMQSASPEGTELAANVLNGHGISFALALNGGLTLPGPVSLGEGDIRVLRALERNNRANPVRNKVIVTHEEMLPLLRSRYPSLEVIASCIQAVNPRQTSGYEARLREYDYVVPMNQHTTHEYLKRYARYAHKLILFLTMRCGRTELAKCHAHYASIEMQFGEEGRRSMRDEEDLPAFEPSALPEDARGCLLLDEFGPRASLLDREDDLSGLMEMGVDKFKVARLYRLQLDVYDRLLRIVQRRSPQISMPPGLPATLVSSGAPQS